MQKNRRAGIIGVGYEGFRPVVSDLSTRELMFEAASKAYEDASVEPRRDIGSFICCTEDFWEGWSITDEMVPDQIAGAGRPVCTITADAITGLGNAVMHLASGVADVVALEAHSKTSDVTDVAAVEAMAQEPSMIRPLEMGNDSLAALEMDAFLRATGYEMEDLDDLIVTSKGRALHNPRASYGARLVPADLRGEEVISTPLRRVDKAQHTEAGIVLVLASEEWIRKNGRDPVYVEGVAWNSSLPWLDGGGDPSVAEYARWSYNKAMGQAGLTGGEKKTKKKKKKEDGRSSALDSFDLMELDDTISFKLLQHLHSIAGGAGEERRVLREEGPVLNPSGGSLGVGTLLEATGMHRLVECVLQLRGEGGANQVRRATRALVQSWRGIPTATGGVAILSR